jgi:Na+-translocating ferredoxin:NAD+ oxidoreductase RnfA subunit
MKTTTRNQYAYANNILIALVSAIFGYNLYQVIVHPAESNIGLSLILVVLTSIMVRKYGYKQVKDKDKEND